MRVLLRRRRGPEPHGKQEEVGRVAEQAAVEQEALGEVRGLRDELVVVEVAVLVGVVATAEGGRGLVEVGGGGMGVQGWLRGPQREGGRGVGTVHGRINRIGSGHRRLPCASGSGDRRSIVWGLGLGGMQLKCPGGRVGKLWGSGRDGCRFASARIAEA